ncbi:unnamed protein product, partial [Rangifer tarandus platyrhynchus]
MRSKATSSVWSLLASALQPLPSRRHFEDGKSTGLGPLEADEAAATGTDGFRP